MKFTPEILKQNAAAMLAFIAGKPIQLRVEFGGPGWSDLSMNEVPSWNCRRVQYRPKPEPVSRPWSKPDDVPGPVCWIRTKKPFFDKIWMVTGIDKEGIIISHANFQTWEALAQYGEYSTDRKTWQKCEVVE